MFEQKLLCSLDYDSDGIIKPGTIIKPDQILISKRFKDKKGSWIDTSIKIPEHDVSSQTAASKCKMVVSEIKKLGTESVSIKVSVFRTIMVGDKVAQRSGQKGSVGAIVDDVNMPRTGEGIIVDAIINCQSFPSRQTIGYFAEHQSAKLASIKGERVNATAFSNSINPYDLAEALHESGYPKDGTERLYDGETGEMITNPITVGIVYEHQLKHLAEPKCYARRSGRKDPVTGEPCKGRKHGGGMRNGEMETDTYCAHGAVNGILMDRTRDSGAPMDAFICNHCGALVFEPSCACGASSTERTKIRTKRPWVVAAQEITGLGAKLRFKAG